MSVGFEFEGPFAIWSYGIGHYTLLLRRVRGDGYQTGVDVVFKDVGWLSLPTRFLGLRVREVAREDVSDQLAAAGAMRELERTVFELSGSDWRGYVFAGAVASHEDEGEYYDPSAFDV